MRKLVFLASILLFFIEISGQTEVLDVSKLLNKNSSTQPTTTSFSPTSKALILDNKHAIKADQFIANKKSVLCRTPNSDLRKTAVQHSKNGKTHHRYQQTWNGIPVEGQYIILHEENGTLNAVNGTMVSELSVNTTPTLSESIALSKVKDNNIKYAWEIADMESSLQAEKNDQTATYFPKGQLVILPDTKTPNADYRLAWKFNVYSADPHDHIQFHVDANSGTVLKKVSLLRHTHVSGNGPTNYNGNKSFTCKHKGNHFELESEDVETRRYTGSNLGIGQPITSLSTTWNNNPDALDVHWGIEKFVEFLNVELGRDGYDGTGKKIRAQIGYPAANAFWDGHNLVYGVGNGTTLSAPTSLDIVAHEYTHAMLDEIVGFQYGGESGAIEEAYCDIFGELIERHVLGTADWRVGGKITQNNGIPNNLGIRNLADPTSFNAPKVYKGQHWHTTPSDNWGVHTNSSVYSYWFHLLAHGNGTTVNGIGLPAATDLMYETLFYLQPYSDYLDLRNNSIVVANLLSQFTPVMIADVEAAWNEVGLGMSSQATINGVVPASGDTIYGGLFTLIQWDTSLSISSVDIQYSTNGGVSWLPIAQTISYKGGSYLWQVPQVYSQSALIQISETSNPALRGISSSYFTIQNTNNLPPIANEDVISTAQGFFEDIKVWTNDLDDVGIDTKSVSFITLPSSSEGIASINSSGIVRVNVDPSFIGTFSFQYQICDSGIPVRCDTGLITVKVREIPTPKWAMDDWGVLNMNETLSRNLLQNDYSIDSTWTFVGWDPVAQSNGSLLIDTQGEYTYLPSSMGRDTIQYVVTNGVIWDTAHLYLFVIEDRPLAKDSMDLVIFYEMRDGPNWYKAWDLSQPISTWFGVERNNLGVTKMDVLGIGPIPDFSSLNYLEHLEFSRMEGPMPDFSNLTNLAFLYIDVRHSEGPIPDFSNLPNLTFLRLVEFGINSPLPDFSNLPNLESLNLEWSDITGAIPDFSNLPNLETIDFQNSQLSGSIPGFSNLPNLAYLNLENNQLTGSIPDFSNLPNLQSINVDYNQLTGSIPSFSNLNQLHTIRMTSNSLSGPIPEFLNLTNLVNLWLNGNNLSGSIPEFLNSPNISNLILLDNQLTGPIPNFSHINFIGNFNFSSNKLSGTLPNFGYLGFGASLNVSDNRLTFDGMAGTITNSGFAYAPQKNIPVIQQGKKLHINPGGDPTKNKITWYRSVNGITVDSAFAPNFYQPQITGYYHCKVTNDVVTQPWTPSKNLVLRSDTVYFVPSCNFISELQTNITVCRADSIDSGFPGMNSYIWLFNGDTLGTSQKLAVYQPGTYIIQMQDSCMNPLVVDSTNVTIDYTCIWPGDTNFDGIVNHYDLQNIGLHYGATGSSRNAPIVAFNAAQSANWSQQTNGGLDLKHVDANGDGIISSSDQDVILANFGKSWGNYTPPVDSAISSLRIIPQINIVQNGVEEEFFIRYSLENSVDTTTNLYGLAFETIIQAPQDISDQIALENNHLPGASKFLSISESAGYNQIQNAFTKIDLTDAILQDANTNLFSVSIGTEMDLPSGDTVSLIQVSTENVRLTRIDGSFGVGQSSMNVQGGTTEITYTEDLAFALTTKPVYCEVNGEIDMQVLKGTAPYSFQWSANANGQTTASATGLTVGTYEVTVTDALANSVSAQISVDGIDKISVNPITTDPTPGQSNGAISLNLSGGSGPFDIEWNTGDVGPSINNLAAGRYIALVNDLATCAESFRFDLGVTPLDLKVYLEGAYDPSIGLMSDDLRTKQVLPLIDPYDYTNSVSSSIFEVSGENAITDWIYVDFTDNNFQTIYSFPALVQRDGDIVGMDGLTHPFIEDVPKGKYNVILTHRNHLPVTYPLSVEGPTEILSHDFTKVDSYKSFGFGQKEMMPGKWVMYTGNGEQTNLELFDINGIDIILWHKTNGVFSIYNNYDYNLDADVTGLDRILFNSNNGVFTTF